MNNKYGLKDVADVKFFNKDTGEEVFVGGVQEIEIEREPIIGKASVEIAKFGHHIGRSIEIGLSRIRVNGVFKAKLFGVHKDKKISRLIYLHDRTKKKRVKKKLNKRILDEIDKLDKSFEPLRSVHDIW